jgi:hypothetical protein
MDELLPTDLESAHAMIRRLCAELEETRRKLSVYVEHERREFEARYGKGVTPQSLLGASESFARAMESIDHAVIQGMIEAEDAGRRTRRRKKS